PELTIMIEAGYDVLTLGNHEFDYGPDLLASYLQLAGYPEMSDKLPILAANTVIPEGHALNEVGLQKTHIKTLNNGLKLGFVGLMGEHAAGVAPLAEPILFADQIESVRSAVEQLKSEGAEVIILLS